jgi:formate dehydrogenase major subunit
MDPLATETSEFWRNVGPFNDVKSADIQTEVIRLPTTCFAEEDGSLVNSSRWLQWHWKGADGPGEAQTDIRIMSELFLRLRKRYQAEAANSPTRCSNCRGRTRSPTNLRRKNWPRKSTAAPRPTSPMPWRGGQGRYATGGFAQLKDDGSTASGCWIFAGSWTEAGQPDGPPRQRRPVWHAPASGLGLGLAGQPADSLQPRLGRRRGKPWDPKKRLVWWNGKAWGGTDVPDFKADVPPEAGMNPFIMNPEGVARFFAVDKMNEGRSPSTTSRSKRRSASTRCTRRTRKPPATRRRGSSIRCGNPRRRDFPYAGTTYRLTEHFHFWSKHCKLNAIAQPEQFVEIGEVLAKEKGIAAGDRVRVSCKRGFIEAVAVVTKRIRPLQVNGQVVHQIGIPLHWGSPVRRATVT